MANEVIFEKTETPEMRRLNALLNELEPYRHNADRMLGRALIEHEIEHKHGRMTREDRDIRDAKLVRAYIDACKKLAGGVPVEEVKL